MAINSIGDMAQTFMMRRMTTGFKREASVAAQELTSGYTADIGQKLGGNLTRLAGLEASLSKLSGYRSVANSVATVANSMQAVFDNIDSLTDGLGTSLLNATNMENTPIFTGLITDASDRFDAVLKSLNAKVGEKSVFAGVASDGPALASSDAILSALETAVVASGAVSAGQIEAAITSWFATPSGFASVGYLGGSASGAVSVSADDTVAIDVTAAAPAIRDTLKSLAMVALVERGNIASDPDTGLALTRLAGAAMFQAQSDRVLLAGRVGLMQARVEQAQTRNEAEGSALKLTRSDLLAVDPYEAATRMEAAQNQLETLYSVTARLSRLRLVDFL